MSVSRIRTVVSPSWSHRILLNPSDSDDEQFSSSDDEDSQERIPVTREQRFTPKAPEKTEFPPLDARNSTHSDSKRAAQKPENNRHLQIEWLSSRSSNIFFNAIKAAATQYSAKLRTCSMGTSAPPHRARTPPSRHAQIVDESAYSEDEDSSDDEDQPESHAYHNVSKADLTRLLYKPVGEWASLANKPINNAKIVARLNSGSMCEAFIKEGDIGDRHITYISKTWALSQKWEGFFSEIALYASTKYLRSLQGDVIPTIIGLYLVEGKISVAMEMPHSSFWIEASPDMPDSIKEKCVEAFDKIHGCGVLHNDVELRHMLISGEGKPVIIDFQLSQALEPQTELGIAACTEDDIRLEKRKVKFKLDFEGAKQKENDKRRRVIGKRKRNAQRHRKHQLKRIGEWDDDISDIEVEDPADIEDPIVEPQIWMDYWVDDFFPSCYIVPGQQVSTVQNALSTFVQEWHLLDAEIGSSSLSTSSSSAAPAVPVQSLVSLKRKRSISTSISGFEKLLDDGQPDFPRRRRRLGREGSSTAEVQNTTVLGEVSRHGMGSDVSMGASNREALLGTSYVKDAYFNISTSGSSRKGAFNGDLLVGEGYRRGNISGFTKTSTKSSAISASNGKNPLSFGEVKNPEKSSQRAKPPSSVLKRVRAADEDDAHSAGKAKRPKHVRLATGGSNDNLPQRYSTLEAANFSGVLDNRTEPSSPTGPPLPLTCQPVDPQPDLEDANTNINTHFRETLLARVEREGVITEQSSSEDDRNNSVATTPIDLSRNDLSEDAVTDSHFSNEACANFFSSKSIFNWWKKLIGN